MDVYGDDAESYNLALASDTPRLIISLTNGRIVVFHNLDLSTQYLREVSIFLFLTT